MGAIISIVVLVALISLYDYFSARRWQQVTSVQRNDLVFEHRNKAYGAYVIRRDYDKRLIIIIAGLILAIGAAYAAYAIVKSIPEDVVEVPKNNDAFAVAAPPVEDVPPPPPPPEVPPMERTVAFVPPVVTDQDVQDVPPVLDADKDKGSSQSQQGSDIPNFDLPPVVSGTPPIPDPPKEVIYEDVEEPAEFVGGKAAMMKFLRDNMKYPETAIEQGIGGKCWLRFIVGSDGHITDVRVTRGVPDCPECDNEAKRVVRAMPKWKPGKIDGKGVKSYFDLPVNFTLQ